METNALSSKCRCKTLFTLILSVFVVSLLAGCTKNVEGEYTSSLDHTTMMVLKSGKFFKKTVGSNTETELGAYTVDGNKVVLDDGKVKLNFTVLDDGSLKLDDTGAAAKLPDGSARPALVLKKSAK